jgi:C4-dicarboxylate-specific signal transduction histidine kinase
MVTMSKKQFLRFRDWPILAKMLVLMLFLSWIPVAVATTFAVTRQAAFDKAKMNHYITSQASDTAGVLQKLISRFIQESREVVQGVAMEQETVRFLEATPAERDRLMENIRNTLADATDSSATVGNVTIYDRQGIAVASRDPSLIGRDDALRNDIQMALAGEQFTGAIHIGPDDVPGFFISTSVRRGPEIIGVVSARLHADFMFTTLENAVSGGDLGDEAVEMYAQDTDVLLIDEDGIVMDHSDIESDWLYRSLKEVDAESIERIRSSASLGKTCPEGMDVCESQEMVPRLPRFIPAAASLGNTFLTAFESGKGGTIRYCHPDDADDPLDESCSSGGWHTAAYEPIHDPVQDRILLLVVVDVPEDALRSSIRRQAVFGISLVTILFAVLIAQSVYVAQWTVRPVRELSSVALAVERGEPFEPESLTHVTSWGDELGQLARVFSDMIVAVQARERKLKQQVQELRIEIDQAKRERHVKEIVEGDFFQDLQGKARQMRAEHSKQDENGE